MNFIRTCIAIQAALLLAGAAAPARAQLPAAERGRISSIDNGAQRLGINTRLGVLLFTWTNQTLFLLNGHSAAQGDMRLNDRVEVDYLYPTGELLVVRLRRTQRMNARVTGTTQTTIGVRNRGAALTLRVDGASSITAAGLQISNNAVLVGERVSVVVEPGQQPLLLNLSVKARRIAGEIIAVDAAAGAITIRDRRERTFVTPSTATLRRDGAAISLANVAVGDSVIAAFTRSGSTRRILVLEASSPSVP